MIVRPDYLDSLETVIETSQFAGQDFRSVVASLARAIFENLAGKDGRPYCRFVHAYVAQDVSYLNELDLHSPDVSFGESFAYDTRVMAEFRLAANSREQKILYLIRNAENKSCFEERRVRSIICPMVFLPGGVTVGFMIGLKPFVSLAMAGEFEHLGMIVRMRLLELTNKPDYPSTSLLDMAPDSMPTTTKENLALARAASREKVVEVINTDFAEMIPHIAWTATPAGKVDFVNKQWYEYTGLNPRNGLTTGTNASPLHADDYPSLNEKWLYSLSSNEPFEVEHRLKRGADDTYRWQLIKASPLTDEDGQVIKWFGTVTDIDNQKQIEKMLRDIMDNVKVAIFWKDLKSVYVGCNKSFARDAGLDDPAQIIGKNDFDMPWSAEETSSFRKDDARVMQNNQRALEFVESQSQNTGRRALLVTSKLPMQDSSGKVTGVLGMYEDITEKENMRIQREDFMSSLAHDMKVPVVAAARVLEFLLRGAAGELATEQIECVRMLFSNNDKLLFLIQNLLEVLNLDSGKAPLKSQQFDFNRLVSAQLTESETALAGKSLTLHQKLTNKSLSFVACEPEIRRAIENLITNAITLALNDSTIKIETDRNDSHILLELNLDCLPITPEEQEYLFERFWQGSKLGIGVGLGFYLCRQIIERRGGQIRCTTSDKSGTTFKISIPFEQPDNDAHSPSVLPSLQRRLY